MPIAKKKRAKGVGEHRGITLLLTTYKKYASVVVNRLREKVEEKGILPEWQEGFRRGRETVDNIELCGGKRTERR